MEIHGFGTEHTRVEILAQPLTSCIPLGKPQNLTGPWLPSANTESFWIQECENAMR